MRDRVRILLAAALAVTAGYQVQRPVVIAVGDSLAEDSVLRDFWGREGDATARWSRSRSQIVFPDPGPDVPVRVEVDLAGWRPRDQAPPLATLADGRGARVSGTPAPRGETFRLDTRTRGLWRSDLALTLESQTFTPGGRDPRALGVRVSAVRLLPQAPLLAPRAPPLAQLLTASLALLLLLELLGRLGASPRFARHATLLAALAAGLGYAAARPLAALAAIPTCVGLALLAGAAAVAPGWARGCGELAAESMRALSRGLREMASGPALALALAIAAAVALAYRARPDVELDVGSGRETPLASGLGAFDSAAGATFRPLLRGARLDLRDFGSGPWRISLVAAAAGGARAVELLRVAGAGTPATLDATWSTVRTEALAPFGWRSGLLLEFPAGGQGGALRLDSLRIERPAALPSLRIVAATAAAALLLGAGFAALGLPRRHALRAAAALAAAIVAGLVADPAIAIPFVLPLLAIVGVATLVMALAAGVAARLALRGWEVPPPGALAAAGAGSVGWLAATAFPLYRGGNFVFHASISEEIWKGRFLLYYLPYPGSMLSQQAHWGGIVVPHPCLEQLLLAPLAALPQPWFHLAVKLALALWLATLAVLAAALAQRVAGERAAVLASVAVACLVPGYQLLGLGHLMTLCGVWAGSLAFAHLVLRAGRLRERGVFAASVALFTLCFLSYFASLLFAGLALVLMIALLWRPEPALARRLLAVTAAASVAAFLLYYVNWAWPFLSQSLPRIFGGATPNPQGAGGGADASGASLLTRLLLQPHKWQYSFGSGLVPLAGLLGLALFTRGRDRVLLGCWGGLLVVVSVLDLKFNFILKHHYFVMVPVAVGLGLLLDRLMRRGPVGRVTAGVALVLLAALGAETALAVALGQIP